MKIEKELDWHCTVKPEGNWFDLGRSATAVCQWRSGETKTEMSVPVFSGSEL